MYCYVSITMYGFTCLAPYFIIYHHKIGSLGMSCISKSCRFVFCLRISAEAKEFCPAKCADRLGGPPNILLSRYRGSFLGLKRPRREFDSLLLLVAAVMNGWSFTFSPLYALLAWTGTFYLYYLAVDSRQFHVFQRTFTIHYSGLYGE
jgi:hypothetical protein